MTAATAGQASGRERPMDRRLNALKHGLTGCIPTEHDTIDLDWLTSALGHEMGVKGVTGMLVLERLVTNYLRLHRAAKLEAELFRAVLGPQQLETRSSADILATLDRLLPGENLTFDKSHLDYLVQCVDRYCTSAENKFYKALRMLLELQRHGDVLADFVSQNEE